MLAASMRSLLLLAFMLAPALAFVPKSPLMRSNTRMHLSMRRGSPLEASTVQGVPSNLPLNDTLSPVGSFSSDPRSGTELKASDVLIIFLVDASSSASAPRIAAVRGAALGILKQPYSTRTKVSIIPFKGLHAQVLVPPTGSIALAAQKLSLMQHGGGSPLAHALQTAAQTGLSAISKNLAKQVLIMCLSDGRANIPLSASLGASLNDDSESWESASSGRTLLRQEVLEVADSLKSLNENGVHFMMVDTDTRVSTVMNAPAQHIAARAGGHYIHAPRVTDIKLIEIAADALQYLCVNNMGCVIAPYTTSGPFDGRGGFEDRH